MKKFTNSLIAILLSSVVMAQWTSDPTKNQLISTPKQVIYEIFSKAYTNGDCYLLYLSPNGKGENGGTICTYLQILSKTGEKKLGQEGLLISEHPTRTWTMFNDNLLIVDNEGNAICVVQDIRNAASLGNDYSVNYSAYKISPTGEFLWGKDGIDLSRGNPAPLEAAMSFIQVGEQFMFAWTRYEMGAAEEEESSPLYKKGIFKPTPSFPTIAEETPAYLVMERLNKEGKFVGETQYIKDNLIPFIYPYLKNANNGQVILVYAKGTNQDLTARKLDFDGSSVWAQDATIYRGGFGGVPIWAFVGVYEDPRGGVFVSWHDDRDFTLTESAYISYIKPDGSYGYATGIEGQKVGFSGLRQFMPFLIYTPWDESAYVIWEENSAGQSWQGIYAQKFDKVGDLMWDVEGVEIQALSQNQETGYYSCQLDDQNRIMNFFMLNILDTIASRRDTKAFACLLESNGKFAWEEDKKFAPITTAINTKSDLISLPLVDKQYVLFWKDSREVAASRQSVFGQNITLNGTLGNTVDNEILHDATSGFYMYPNPVQNQAEFMIKVKGNSKVSLNIYNSLGQKINTVFEGNLNSGGHEFSWDATQYRKGIYFAVLNNNGKSNSFKIIHK